ncbi:MAG: NAD(P)H-dependent oxidoreductase [Oscillospiraceae bacterium]
MENTDKKIKVLYINSCVRGNLLSRTQKIADAFLDELERSNPNVEITEKNLMLMNPLFLNYFNFKQHEELISQEKYNHSVFDLAREFAAADRIVIAAPLWELSYPAILRVYLENVSVAGIAFKYGSEGAIGLCRAEKLMYITTRGDDFSRPPLSQLEMGARHIEALCGMYGIKSFDCIAADGLDLLGANPDKIVAAAIETAKAKARSFI